MPPEYIRSMSIKRRNTSAITSFQTLPAYRDTKHASFLDILISYRVNRYSSFLNLWINQSLDILYSKFIHHCQLYSLISFRLYILSLFHVSCTACTYPLFVRNRSVIIARRSQSAAETRERLLPIISCQVDPDQLIQTLQDRPALSHKHHIHTRNAISSITPYSSRYSSQQEISKFKIPQDGAPADAVHQMLKDELDLDGRPNLNLARLSIA